MSTAPLRTPLQEAFQHAESNCIKCGFCLPTCPTYRLTSNEAASPRGRIDLMQSVADGVLEVRDIVAQLDFCLGCRACESACPAGVEFGKLLEAGRAEARLAPSASSVGKWIQRFVMQRLLPSPTLLHGLAHCLRMYQVSGLQHLLQTAGVLQRLAPTLATMDKVLPTIPAAAERVATLPETPPVGAVQGHVALLTGCIMPEVFPEVNRATVQVLAGNGYRVSAPVAQRCCGALQAHAGELEVARALAKHNIAVFEATAASWIVVNSAGCGAMMKEYGYLLAADPDFAARAEAFSKQVLDISEVLSRAPLRGPLQPLPMRVAYDDPCHLLHGQTIRQQPRALLQQVPELQLLDVPESDWCCGSAGTYNLFHPDTANTLLDRKMMHLAALQPDLIVTGNPGCILQLRQGVARQQLSAQVLHPVQVLAQAYSRHVS